MASIKDIRTEFTSIIDEFLDTEEDAVQEMLDKLVAAHNKLLPKLVTKAAKEETTETKETTQKETKKRGGKGTGNSQAQTIKWAAKPEDYSEEIGDLMIPAGTPEFMTKGALALYEEHTEPIDEIFGHQQKLYDLREKLWEFLQDKQYNDKGQQTKHKPTMQVVCLLKPALNEENLKVLVEKVKAAE